ncbi:Alpha/Beta hydrolase protein [Crepidotus variabilis]|uniref:Alpha/Beta hydrolase protein n=1 Tax=Crepidotus variabilis TaxID=179855 RepID=A0A9P6JKT9_9AGAR|nr:Alpha/Beta hydrolase protein [Crepidotus variabilis]
MQRVTTICYKTLDESTPICFDAYLRPEILNSKPHDAKLAAVVYFHAGGLSVGNKTSWFPKWLCERVLELGLVFISVDYQLMPPASGYDMVKDIQDLITFLANNEITGLERPVRINPDRIAVSGTSGGGLCVYLAAMHCSPRPRALFSLYGMGGNFLIPHYFKPKSDVFFRGRELLDAADFSEFTHPFKNGPLSPVVDSPLSYYPQTNDKPGYPANPRMLLPRLYLQQGLWLDYYTQAHSPSLSESLLWASGKSSEKLDDVIPSEYRALFPQLHVDKSWPATLLFHGTSDTAVPIEESRHLKTLLEKAKVPVQLLEFEGQEHAFDYEPNSEEMYSAQFHLAAEFLRDRLAN